MNFKRLPPGYKSRLLAARRFFGRSVYAMEAEKWGVKTDTIRRYLHGHKFPPSPTQPQHKPLHIHTDNALVISDLEVPDHDARLLENAATLAGIRDLDTCIIAGDFLANDHFLTGRRARRQALPYSQIIELADAILETLAQVFDTIVILPGNHDDRLISSTNGHIGIDKLLTWPQGCETIYTPIAYLYVIPSNGAPTMICHPVNYSKNALTVAQQLYENDQGPYYPEQLVKPHVMMAHTHSGQQGRSRDGWRKLMTLGCIRGHAEYKDHSRTTYPQWVKGFGTIEDGEPYLYNDAELNWATLLGRGKILQFPRPRHH